MIVGLLVVNNRTNEVVVRTTCPLLLSKMEQFLFDFMSFATPTGSVIVKELYKYVYAVVDSVYYAVITSSSYSSAKARQVLDVLQRNTDGNPIDALVTIDNILYGQVLFDIDVSLIKNMDSQEEKIHEMIAANKMKEVVQRQVELQRKMSMDDEKERKVVGVERNNKEMQQFSRSSVGKANVGPTKERKRFETSTSPVFILFKEKLKMIVDKENKVKSGEVRGEMTLTIKEEKHKDLRIKLNTDGRDLKFNPNLDKFSAGSGMLVSERGFPVNNSVALVKWRDSSIRSSPVTFTFWPSETSLNTYQITLECTVEYALDDFVIFIPKTRISNVVLDNFAKEGNSHIEWNIGSLEKGGSETLEFCCTCTDPSDVFPLDVYFTSDFTFTQILIESIEHDGRGFEDVDVRKVFEVDKFNVVDE